ncbi:MAG: hypothetical protein R3281_17415 [Balneolaceae bacterium]|nr:hypothetical protein [Balneolaceae bacterium]
MDHRERGIGWIVLMCTVFMVSCGGGERQAEGEAEAAARNVVEVSAVYDSEQNRHLFETSSDTIRSGWTTFRFTNTSPMAHFMVVEKMPGRRTSVDSEREVVPIFQKAMDLINSGDPEAGFAALGELPEWFSEVTFMGGPGLASPGRSFENTVYLQSGNYVLECYVKTEQGEFHSAMGMVRDLRVTRDSSFVREPQNPTLNIDLSNNGIVLNGDPVEGDHLVAVQFNEEEPPLLGNDVHVARMAENVSTEQVTSWIDWSQPDGLVSSAESPAPVTFLGGTHEMPMGATAYFTVTLTPGQYMLVSERPAGNPLYHTFTVSGMASN